jgi:hypothetical protein
MFSIRIFDSYQGTPSAVPNQREIYFRLQPLRLTTKNYARTSSASS